MRLLLPLALACAAHGALAKDKPEWHTPRAAFHLLGNTWYVGTEAITVLLIRGSEGAILIDTGVPKSAASVLANIEAAGAKPSDIAVILTSHAHLDHTGAIAQLKQATGARVLASAASQSLLEAGGTPDLHFGDSLPYPPVTVDGVLEDGEQVTVGDLQLVAHFTPAHTPGSTSWTWTEQVGDTKYRMAYVDSITAPGYRLLDNPGYPDIVDDFRRGFDVIRALPCDVLLTPHPEASMLFERHASGSLAQPDGCRNYADRGEKNLDRQIAEQQAEPTS